MKWIKIEKDGKKPEQEEEVFLDGGENPPAFARFRTKKGFDYAILIDSSGEEEYYDWYDYESWLDESPLPSNEDELWKEVEQTLKDAVNLDPYRSGKIVSYLQSRFSINRK